MSREGALWMGGLEPYMDETFIMNAFEAMGERNVVSIKLMRNKFTTDPVSYGFVNFNSDPAAIMAMHKLNGKVIPNTQPPNRFKLNHSSTRTMDKDLTVWVGDLSPDVHDFDLYSFFVARFTGAKSAKVVIGPDGQSKGYGFVRFSSTEDHAKALSTMNGASGLGSNPMKVGLAQSKTSNVPAASSNQGYAAQPQARTTPSAAVSYPQMATTGHYQQQQQQQQQTAAYQAQQWQNYYAQYAAWNQAYGNGAGSASMTTAAPQQRSGYPATDNGMHYHQNSYSRLTPVAAAPPTPTAATAEIVLNDAVDEFGRKKSIFSGPMSELVDHKSGESVDDMNAYYMCRSEQLYSDVEASRWGLVNDI